MKRLWPFFVSATVLASTPEEEAARKSLLRQAQEASDAGNHEAALSLAQRAAQIRSHPSVRYFIAEEQRELGQLADSMNSAKLCVLEATQSKGLKNRDEILHRCNSLLNRPANSVARIVISFPDRVPAQTQVLVGTQVVPEPLYGREFFVTAGQIHIEANAPGRLAFERDLILLSSEEVTVTVSLPEPAPVAPVAPPVVSEERALPPPPPPVSATVVTTASHPSGPIGPYVVLGAGGASLAASVVFLLARNNQINKLEAQCNEQNRSICLDVPAVRSARERASRYNTLTNVTLGVGTAAAIGGAIWLYFDKRRSGGGPIGAEVQFTPIQNGALVGVSKAF